MLRVIGLTVHHGAMPAVREADLAVGPGQLHALVGANGAGKSTLLAALAGHLRPSIGTITLDGHPVTRSAYRAAPAGIALVPQDGGVFPHLTVAEHFRLHRYTTNASGLAEAGELFPRLGERSGLRAGMLSGGEQRMLAVTLALAVRPRLLLLDEPTEGLARELADTLHHHITALAGREIAVLIATPRPQEAANLGAITHTLDRGRLTTNQQEH
ncbi:hypothetical protein BIV57_10805 [Mangrovactinospora gilvigrisea]|uniref:ABC transporter domain-containing protein n=1 Tax=Mangrovactinospora gilvigrisea TaxID=1428644 RepID=A0A1J7CCQ0_9ACTN|nr:ATP-binding cassette domain-containing protein [Mangrovactinospora gilvigrisea]OIV37450.1 hypothetical protein BIV57_10805 [Mangrovactinospora gilvigrisea]